MSFARAGAGRRRWAAVRSSARPHLPSDVNWGSAQSCAVMTLTYNLAWHQQPGAASLERAQVDRCGGTSGVAARARWPRPNPALPSLSSLPSLPEPRQGQSSALAAAIARQYSVCTAASTPSSAPGLSTPLRLCYCSLRLCYCSLRLCYCSQAQRHLPHAAGRFGHGAVLAPLRLLRTAGLTGELGVLIAQGGGRGVATRRVAARRAR